MTGRDTFEIPDPTGDNHHDNTPAGSVNLSKSDEYGTFSPADTAMLPGENPSEHTAPHPGHDFGFDPQSANPMPYGYPPAPTGPSPLGSHYPNGTAPFGYEQQPGPGPNSPQQPYGYPGNEHFGDRQPAYGQFPPPPAAAGWNSASAPTTTPYADHRPQNSLALISLITGVLSFPLMCAFGAGVLTAIAAIVTGFLGRAQLKREPYRYKGDSMALAGIICGFVVIALTVLFIALVVILAAIDVGNDTGGYDYDF